ncbi:uncharacterized protein LOC115219865 [Octopus sinensis]|uniref:Uncharacterized protein LOC115219865 n=1 Tax=Octopus sinensis TaxID=2607531 RepID=A0A6P7T6I8_9MOLL|nr:uncharacterized protein LOC115219865 [Octopus sinensis]XP_029646020.1 uncharacterized protein LOC115219865 [Octopus sinensis]XP_029646021.1 uncharacterized protein LOC115219865 [Octopus sinensis]
MSSAMVNQGLQPADIINNVEELLQKYLQVPKKTYPRALALSAGSIKYHQVELQGGRDTGDIIDGVAENLRTIADELERGYGSEIDNAFHQHDSNLNQYGTFRLAAENLLSNIQTPILQLGAVFELCKRYTSAYPAFSGDGIIEQHAVRYIRDHFTPDGTWKPERN